VARPKVTAIVLTYNGWDMLRQSLPTVLAQDWPGLEILVVDDCSQDGTPEKLAQEFPTVQVLALPENHGFAGASNAGVEFTRGEYVALLNNDIYLPTNFISRMVEILETCPQAAVAGPGVYNLKLNMAHYPYNGSMSLTGTVIHNVFKDPALTFGAAGCSLVFKRSLLGLPFDADYRFFHEEIYLAWRARLLGYTVLRLPDVVVKHVGGATVGDLKDENRFLLERNRCLNFLTFFSKSTRLRIWPLMLLARLVERLGDWQAGRSGEPIRRARQWIRRHRSLLQSKRHVLQSQRRIPDKDIICWMSYKITNHYRFSGKLVNRLAYFWCRLVGLKTWEMTGGKNESA